MAWSMLIAPIMGIIDKLIPDPQAKAEAQLKILAMQQAGEFKQLEADLAMSQGQVDINKIEAASDNIFKSGWRPFVGWICGSAFAAKYLGGPLVFMIAQFWGIEIKLPPIEMMEMLPVLLGMLGLGAYRTYEKTKQ